MNKETCFPPANPFSPGCCGKCRKGKGKDENDLRDLSDRVTELEEEKKVVGIFGFTADNGTPNEQQGENAQALKSFDPDAVFVAGDVKYDDSSLEEVWAAYQPLVDEGKVFPCPGNHDLDYDWDWSLHRNFFSYLEGEGFPGARYYTRYFPEADLQLFSLNSGLNTAGELVEADGNSVGSAQYNWFVNAVNHSTAKWKVVQFHHPFIHSQSGGNGREVLAMDWNFEELGVNLVIQGHNHYTVRHVHDGLNYINYSTGSQPVRPVSRALPLPNIYGVKGGTRLLWYDDGGDDGSEEMFRTGLPCVGKMLVYEDRLVVQAVRHNGVAVHSFEIRKDA